MQGISQTSENLRNRSLNSELDPFELYRQASNLNDELEKAERELRRPTRGRKAIRPTANEKEALEEVIGQLRHARQLVSNVVRRTERQSQRSAQGAPAPPQVAILAQAVSALEEMASGRSIPLVEESLSAIESAASNRAVGRAVAVLDELRAKDVPLSDDAEVSRKELRALLGWSPTGPVTLNEALAETSFSASTEREEAILRAVDNGILEGVGGRGQRYEAALRAVVDSIAGAEDLQ